MHKDGYQAGLHGRSPAASPVRDEFAHRAEADLFRAGSYRQPAYEFRQSRWQLRITTEGERR